MTLPCSAFRFVLLVGLVAAPAAQSVRLNDLLRDQPEGSVASFRVVPGGTRVVFRGDLSATSDTSELYSAPIDGSAPPVELGTSSLPGLIRGYEGTADGNHVVLLNRSPDLTQHLYRLSVSGGAPLLLSGALDVDGLLLDPTGTRVVFRSRDGLEIWSAPTDASSAPLRLNGTALSGAVEDDYRISPDGAWVVYRAAHDAAGETDLYSAPIDGHAPAQRLNLPRPLADVLDFQIAFDSLGVVYRADQDTDELLELYAVEIDGDTAPVKRSAVVPSGPVRYFQLAASSDRLVFLVEEPAQSELCSVRAIQGGTPLRLAGFPSRPIGDFDLALTADGARAVYRAYPEGLRGLYGVPTDGSAPAVRLTLPGQWVQFGANRVRVVEQTGRVLFVSAPEALYSAPLDGSQPAIRLSGAARSGATLELHDVLADGSALYTADPVMVTLFRLFRVPSDGSAPPITLTPDLASGSFVSGVSADVVAAPGTARVVYLLRGWVNELFSVPAVGGGSARLSGALPPGRLGGSVAEFRLAPAGDRVVFLAEESPAYARDLHSAATDGGGRSIELNPVIGPQLVIHPFAISADGEWVVYRLQNVRGELHASRTALRGHDVRLDRAPVPETASVEDLAITPDSQQVIFAAASSIYAVPIDGAQPPRLLVALATGAARVALSPDGAWLDYFDPSNSRLMSLPIDGHQGPVVLDDQFVHCGLTAFTPDSKRLLYVADRAGTPLQIYSVLVDGSRPPIELGVAAPAGSLITGSSDYRISPDSTRVVFPWIQAGSNRELHSAPVDGSQPAVKLNLTSTPYAVFDTFQIDPTSSRVIYATEEESNITAELYSAPLDGSAPRIKIGGDLLPGQNVAAFQGDPFRITADGRVIHAVSDTVGRQSLRIVPLDGSRAPLVLSLAQPSMLELDTRGESALFIDNGGALRRVPLDGSEPSRIIAPSRVLSFRVSADGEHVVYGADHGDLMIELFSAFLERPKRRSGAPAGLR